MHCGWLQTSAKNRLNLVAFETYPLEYAHQLSISSHLTEFIKRHNLAHSFLSVALSSPLAHEEFVRLSKASPSLNDFALKQTPQWIWQYHYLHALDDGHHLFYLKGIKKSHYFEYQLLAHQTNLNLVVLTSNYTAQLKAYQHLYGKAFRQSQLSLDLAKNNYNIAACMSRDNIARLMQVNPAAQSAWNFKDILATMVGCYNLEKGT